MRRLALASILVLLAGLTACSGAGRGPTRADRMRGPVPDGPWRWAKVPVYEDEDVPICERTPHTTQQIRFVRKTKEVEEPVYRNVRVPITEDRCDPCTGEIRKTTVGWRNDRVYAGTRTRRVFDGYEPEERPGLCTWRNEVTGTETKQVLKGWRWERVPVGSGAPPGAADAGGASAVSGQAP